MRRIILVTGLALLVAGCGSGTAAPPLGQASLDPTSPKAVTERAVARTLHAVALPTGAHDSTADEAQAITWEERPDSPNLVAEHATYVVPLSASTVLAFYDAHPPSGTVPDGSSSSSGRDGIVTQGREFESRRRDGDYQYLEVQIGVQSLSANEALLRIDVQATWIPDATGARIPDSATSVHVVRVSDGGAVQRATLTGKPVRLIADLINRQHVAPPGTYNCPNERGGHDVLTFRGPWPDHRYAVDPAGCGFIDVQVGGTKLDAGFFGGALVDALLEQILEHR